MNITYTTWLFMCKQLLWNEEEKMWLDFDNLSGKSRNYFYASNLAPLWTGSYDEKLSKFYGDAAVDYLIRNQIINDDLVPRYICEFNFNVLCFS
jgi:alpha,alpha-trehalase